MQEHYINKPRVQNSFSSKAVCSVTLYFHDSFSELSFVMVSNVTIHKWIVI